VRGRGATLRFEGEARFSATTDGGRTLVFGDDPGANEQSPMELLTTVIAACSAMDVISILEKKRQVIDAYTIRVDAQQRDEYPQILTRVDVVHTVEGASVDEAAVRRAIELSASRYCPVNAMVSAGATEVHHRYRIRGRAADPLEVEGEVMVTGPYRRPDVIDS
jgi:putative redox protein